MPGREARPLPILDPQAIPVLGVYLSPLTNSDQTLLSAMSASVGVVWAIGFAVYEFIWNYFWSWAKHPENRKERSARISFWQHLIVFNAYLVLGLLAFYSIYVSGGVLLSGEREGLPSAWSYFLATVVGYVVLFTFEIGTSILSVTHLIRERD